VKHPTAPRFFLFPHNLLQGELGKSGQDERRLVDAAVVVPVALVLLLGGNGADGLAEVAGGVLGAHHEADLAGRVGRDRRIGVLGDREHLAAGLLEVGYELEVEPLVLSCRGKQMS